MGCSKSKPIAKDKKIIDGPIDEETLAKMDRAERFEVTMPLSRTDIVVYCTKIKELKPEKQTLTSKELCFELSNNKAWGDSMKDSHVFQKVLKDCTLLRDKENPNELSKRALLLWGVIECGGSSEVKVKCFYEILQEKKESIA